MEDEDEETILDQDSNNLIRKLKQKEKTTKLQEKRPQPETPTKSRSKLPRSQLGQSPGLQPQPAPFLPSHLKEYRARKREEALLGPKVLKTAVIKDEREDIGRNNKINGAQGATTPNITRQSRTPNTSININSRKKESTYIKNNINNKNDNHNDDNTNIDNQGGDAKTMMNVY